MNDGIPEQMDEEPLGAAAFRGVAKGPGRAPIALAVAALALVGVAVLTRSATEPATATLESTPPQRAIASPEPAVRTSIAPTLPPLSVRDPAVIPHSTIPPVPAEVGTNELIPAGRTSLRVTMTLPAGWTRLNASVFARTDRAREGPSASISAWSLMHVNVFPCRWSADIFADDDLMRSAPGQAQALASWWGQDPGMPANSNAAIAPLATKPERTTLGGFPAWYLEVLIPTRLDLAQCDGGELILWHTATGEARRSLGPGELSSIWVIDVEGQPIIVDLATFPKDSEKAAELEAIVASFVIRS